MRRTVAALAAPLLLVTLAACASNSPSEDPSDPPVAEAPQEPEDTAIETLWIDDSWTVEDLDEDLCSMGMSETIYSEQDDMFTCGPNAAGADACALEDDEEVLCIVNALDKQAVRFDSPTAADPDAEVWPSEQQPVPLHAQLPDGAICSTVTHDHDQHWNSMFSWYRCDDNSELLTKESIDATFERGDLWISERSVDKGEPESTRVVTATFAGR
ncbi:hypothetical protein [Brachybacterium sp. FME24]|uniref:hypothetical protein n=1 Tax=Brachybacterium sp. FME24 TaxID=2742605 RepID=UPI001865CD76|nr:hypothetical protein [Brachybacterium sp. FME24]